jgi:hypothetical protein
MTVQGISGNDLSLAVALFYEFPQSSRHKKQDFALRQMI